MHRLLERQIKRVLEIEPEDWPAAMEKLLALADEFAERAPEASYLLTSLPTLLERVSESYAQLDRDTALVRRSLELSSAELTSANQRLRAEAKASAQALQALRDAFDLLVEDYQAGLPEGETASLVDISEKLLWLTRQREAMRKALSLSEERFDLAMKGANDGLWDWDLKNNTVYYSPRWKEMIGHAIDEVGDGGDEWIERLHPADRQRTQDLLREYLARPRGHYECSFRFKHKAGHYIWVLSRGMAVLDDAGQPIRLVGTHSDITARTELERQLGQFKNALDMHAIVSVTDAAGNIVYANDRFCEVSKYTRAELLGGNHRIVKSGLHDAAFYGRMWQTITSGHVWHGEVCNRAKDGDLYWVLATIAPMLDDDGLPYQYISIRADITETKKTQESLRLAKEAAEAANKAKSEFLAKVSHEIRTPMNGVLGMLDLALATRLDDEQREYIDIAHRSADSLMDIINDILDLSKIEAGRLEIQAEPFKLIELLHDLAVLFERRCQAKHLEFRLDLVDGLPRRVLGDVTRIRQVLVNLLGNAIKFTSQGGITLSARREADGAIRFAVRDTGIGIAEEKQAAVFEAFTQADGTITRKFGGTGLGLTISENLVRLMSGRFGLTSKLGEGSEFSFTLPLRPIHEEAVESAPSADAGLRILLVEDNVINQKLAATLLGKAGHAVACVASGGAALAALNAGNYDAVLMDMQLPDMDGIETTRRIRAREQTDGAPRQCIIALTGNVGAEDRRRCLDAGMDDFLGKPLKRDELLAALARVAPRPTGA
jgi:PAS domain S-box-containing protein